MSLRMTTPTCFHSPRADTALIPGCSPAKSRGRVPQHTGYRGALVQPEKWKGADTCAVRTGSQAVPAGLAPPVCPS